MKAVVALFAGILFGAGVTISGMTNPMKVLNFMDLAGAFDATLIFVMGAALIVTFIGYRLSWLRSAPLFDRAFHLPGTQGIDARLISGAVLFGLGWGISGLCPGPAVAGLVFGHGTSFIFVIAMSAGMLLTKSALEQSASRRNRLRSEICSKSKG
jgi:uncharacterized protein